MIKMHYTNPLFEKAAKKTPALDRISGNDELLKAYCAELISKGIDPSSIDVTVTIRPVISESPPGIDFHINTFSVESNATPGNEKIERTAYDVLQKYERYKRRSPDMPKKIDRAPTFSETLEVVSPESNCALPALEENDKTYAIRQRIFHLMQDRACNTEDLRRTACSAVETLVNSKYSERLNGHFEINVHQENAYDIGRLTSMDDPAQVSFHPNSGAYDHVQLHRRSFRNGIDLECIAEIEEYDDSCLPGPEEIDRRMALQIIDFAKCVAWPMVSDWLQESKHLASKTWNDHQNALLEWQREHWRSIEDSIEQHTAEKLSG